MSKINWDKVRIRNLSTVRMRQHEERERQREIRESTIKMTEPKDLEIKISDQVKEKIVEDPDLAKAMKDVQAIFHQAHHGVQTGQYKTLEDGIESLTGSRPELLDGDRMPISGEKFSMVIEKAIKLDEEDEESSGPYEEEWKRHCELVDKISEMFSNLKGRKAAMIGGVLAELIGTYMASYNPSVREKHWKVLEKTIHEMTEAVDNQLSPWEDRE